MSTLTTLTSKINRRLSSLFSYDPITKIKVHRIRNIEMIGTGYGGWRIPQGVLSDSSVCYLAGAGEDISFDTGIAEQFGCRVFIFDPTPKAVKHFESLKTAFEKGIRFPINNSDTLFYTIEKERFQLLHFNELGLWDREDVLKFFVPQKSEHASYSILNIQRTESYVEAKVDRLSHIMNKLGHSSIDLLKLDIEGAEYKVLETVIEDRLIIPILCVEYDEAHFPLDENHLTRIKNSLLSLIHFGYVIVDCMEPCNYTLVRKELFSRLN